MATAGNPGGPLGLVFTDLDGTLLDHHTYDADAAAPALAALRAAGIPVVPCSSKTRTEILALMEYLDLWGPFIPENGGAVLLRGGGAWEELFPGRWADRPAAVLGTPYPALCTALAGLRGHLGAALVGFGDATDAEVAGWTGLPLAAAARARRRDFDEPFRWSPEPAPAEVAAARAWLGARGLQLTRGGRFWHVLGTNDKGRAARWLLRAVATRWGAEPPSLALGDSENDLPLLAAAREGVLVARPGGGHLAAAPAEVARADGVGSVGWCGAVLAWLGRLGV